MFSRKSGFYNISYGTLLLTMVLVIILAVVFISSDVEKKNYKDNNVLKIGANMEMSGTMSSFGKSATSAAQLAISEINAKGGVLDGRKLELVIVDNKSDSIEATKVLGELLSKNDIVAVLAPIASSSVIASADIHQEKKILGISPTASNPAVTVNYNSGRTREYLFRATFIDPFQGFAMANFASHNLQATKAVVYIDNDSEYSKGLGNFFEKIFVENGGKIISKENYFQKDTDFKSTLQKIKTLNPDVVFVPGYYQEVGLIIKQARAMGITVPIIGGDGWDSSSLTKIIGDDSVSNLYFSTHYSPDDSSPALKVFVNSYKKAYNEVPDGFAALAYDATMMIIEAIKRANSADPIKIRDELEKTKNYESVSGTITLNDQHDAVKSVVIMKVKDGKIIFKEKINP